MLEYLAVPVLMLACFMVGWTTGRRKERRYRRSSVTCLRCDVAVHGLEGVELISAWERHREHGGVVSFPLD